MNDPGHPNILIRQAEAKQIVAIIAHMRQILSAVLTQDMTFFRPVLCDHPQVIIAAASLRALFFDDSPSPMLLTFLKEHAAQLQVETLETDSSMLLLSEVESEHPGHISDLLMQILLDEHTKSEFKLDEPHPFVGCLPEGSEMFSDIAKNDRIWAPGPGHKDLENTSLGYQPDTGIFQFTHITRRIVDLDKWGDVRIGRLREKPIRRRSIACYVANKLGGVHYDSTRLPPLNADADEFRLLATAYDWDNQAVTHAGIVAIFLMCVELVRMPWFLQTLKGLEQFHYARQRRLVAGPPRSTSSDSEADANP